MHELAPGDELDVAGVRVRAVRPPTTAGASRSGRRWTPWASSWPAPSACTSRATRSASRAWRRSTTPSTRRCCPSPGWGPRLGPGHMDPRQAAEALVLLRPTLAVPIHWGTYAPMRLRGRGPESPRGCVRGQRRGARAGGPRGRAGPGRLGGADGPDHPARVRPPHPAAAEPVTMTATSPAATEPFGDARRYGSMLIAMGVLGVIAGVLAIVYPDITLLALAYRGHQPDDPGDREPPRGVRRRARLDGARPGRGHGAARHRRRDRRHPPARRDPARRPDRVGIWFVRARRGGSRAERPRRPRAAGSCCWPRSRT